MNIQDTINATFELFGGIAIWFNIFQILEDKHVAGVSWVAVAFFMFWGIWNIYYYKHLNQIRSWLAGCFITFSNFVWFCLILYYL